MVCTRRSSSARCCCPQRCHAPFTPTGGSSNRQVVRQASAPANHCNPSQLFIAATPQHWCRIPELEPWTQDYLQLVKNLSIPRNELGEHAECSMFVRNYSELVCVCVKYGIINLDKESY